MADEIRAVVAVPFMSNGKPLSVVGLTIGVAAVGIEALFIAPLLGDIATTFNTTAARAAWAVSVYGLTLAIVAPVIALAGSQISRKTTMTTGMIVFILAGLLCAFAAKFWVLMLARALCGAAAGAFLPACYAYVGDAAPYADRAKVMGRVMAGWSLALIVGIPMGGLMAQMWGWRSAFIAVSMVGVIAALLIIRLPAPIHSTAQGARSAATESFRRIFRDGIPLLLAVNFFDVLSFYGVYTFLGVVVRTRMGLGSAGFGVLVLCYGVGLLFSTLNARLLDRWGKERVLTIGLSALAVQIALLPAAGLPVTLSVFMALWGVSQGFVQTGTATLVTEASGGARGLAMALMSCGTYLAVGLGSLSGGWLLESYGFTALAGAGAGAVLMALLLLRLYITRLGAP